MKMEIVFKSGEKETVDVPTGNLFTPEDELFLRSIWGNIEEIRAERIKIYPLHYNVSIFIEARHTVSRKGSLSIWKEETYVGGVDAIVAALKEPFSVYTTVNAGKSKMLLFPAER